MGSALIAKAPSNTTSSGSVPMSRQLIRRTSSSNILTYNVSGSFSSGSVDFDMWTLSDTIAKDDINSNEFLYICIFARYQLTNIKWTFPTSIVRAPNSETECHFYTSGAYDRTYGLTATIRQFESYPILSCSTGSWAYTYIDLSQGNEYDGPIDFDAKIVLNCYFNRSYSTQNDTITFTMKDSYIELWGITFV